MLNYTDGVSAHVCLIFGWCWVLLGLVSGTAIGLFFHRPGWLGGYDAWPRRMVRLGHIAFFGTGILSLLFALSVMALARGEPAIAGAGLVRVAGACWTVGAVAMPSVCFLSAWRKPFRQLFAIPVLALLAGCVLMCWVVLKEAA